MTAGHVPSALGRYVRWQIESRLRSEIEFPWIGTSKLLVRNGMTGATGNIYCGLHEFADMGFLLHVLRPDDVFVDVGANIGSYTILASAVCGATSIAFEPDPDTVVGLRRNLAANRIGDRVTVVEAAVGAAEGRIAFTTGQDTTNRVAAPDEQDTRIVDVTTLDRQLAGLQPALIKLDIEGHESDAIAGARATLQKSSVKALLLETVDADVSEFLKGLGFARVTYDPLSRTLSGHSDTSKQRASGNTLFVRDLESCRARLLSAPRRRVLQQDL